MKLQRGLSLLLAVLLLFGGAPISSAAAAPLYLVELIAAGQVTGDVDNESVYQRSGCQREYASTGEASGTPEGAVWLGNGDGTAYREFFNGFRFHTQAYLTQYAFDMPEGYNTFSGTTGVCWHVDSPEAGYNQKTVARVFVNDVERWNSGPIQIRTGYDFSVHAEPGDRIRVTVDSVDGNTIYGHICFGDPALTYDPDYIPADVSLNNSAARPGTPLEVRVDTGDRQVALSYRWTADGQPVGEDSATYTPTDADLEKTLTCTVFQAGTGTALGSAGLFCSRIPVLYLNTDSGGEITDKERYQGASMYLSGDAAHPGLQYDGRIQIKGRGNATWSMPKQPYHIKLDSKADLLGMGKAKHWVLLANYQDECFLRNKLSMDLSGAMGLTYMESRWVDVILNGRCVGNYLLCEQVRVGSTRVDITDWEDLAEDIAKAVAKADPTVDRDALEVQLTEHLEWITSETFDYDGKTYAAADYAEMPDPDGGYLLEMDRYQDEASMFWTSRGLLLKVNRPEFLCTNADRMGYLSDYIQALEDACTSPDFTALYQGVRTHYADLVDLDSYLKWWLVEEVFFNWDAGYNSNYMYKAGGEKLVFGPVWDMDITAGAYYDSYIHDQWQLWHYDRDGIQNLWLRALAADPYFLTKAYEYYWEYRPLFGDLMTRMEEAYPLLKESGEMNTRLWRNQRSFEEDYQALHDWMENHLAWMDQQMADPETFRRSFGRYQQDAGAFGLEFANADGSPLAADDHPTAPAQGLYAYGGDLTLRVTAAGDQTEVYLNGRLYETLRTGGGSAALTLPNAALRPETGRLTVLTFDTYQNGQLLARTDYTLAEAAPVQVGLSVETQPDTTVYPWNAPLDLTGLTVVQVWSDGARVPIEDYQVSGYVPTAPGEQTLTVTDGLFSASFTVTVLDPPLVRLEATLTGEAYPWNYRFTPSDLIVTGVYADGHTEPCGDFTLSQALEGGTWRITLTVGEISLALEAPLSFLPGDLNRDGKLTVADVVLLRRAVLTGGSPADSPEGDLNRDAALTVADVVLLRRAVLNG